MTDLSIITVSYKGWDRLRKSLDALSSFKADKIVTEVIIVDNNSDDGTLSELESQYPSVKFVRNPVNGGFANGCNLGAEHSTGEYLLFLNPDTVASEDALEKLLEIARLHTDISILSCRQVNEKGKESIASGEFPEFWNLTGFLRAVSKSAKALFSVFTQHRVPSTEHPAPRSASWRTHPAPLTPDLTFPGWVSGSVILIRKDLFQNIDGFDEDFWMYYEDVDICKRVCVSGSKVAICNNVTIEHNHGGSSRVNIRTTALTKTEVNISRHVYISKHKSGIERLFIQSFLVINNLLSSGIMALIGILFFFVPKLFARTLIFVRLAKYYSGALKKRSWISPRSVSDNSVKLS
jgi:GT2 family glycosyltransferase